MPAKAGLALVRAPATQGVGMACSTSGVLLRICSTSSTLTCLPVRQDLGLPVKTGIFHAPAGAGRGCACSTSRTSAYLADEQDVDVPAGWPGFSTPPKAGLSCARAGTGRGCVCSTGRALKCLLEDEQGVNVPADWAELDNACEGRTLCARLQAHGADVLARRKRL